MKALRVLLLLQLVASLPAMAQQCPIHTYADPSSNGGNIFVGINSGNTYMSPGGGEAFWASYNTALGRNTLALNQTGWENTAVGANALYSNIDGFHNTAVGYVSLASNS